MITTDTSFLTLFQQSSWISLLVYIVLAIGLWRVFEKAGQPGWAAIVPVVNVYFLLKIGGKPWWWLLLLLIPLVNVIVLIMLAFSVGMNFGKGGAFSFFLLLIFAPIGYLILGFGDAAYRRLN